MAIVSTIIQNNRFTSEAPIQSYSNRTKQSFHKRSTNTIVRQSYGNRMAIVQNNRMVIVIKQKNPLEMKGLRCTDIRFFNPNLVL